MVPFGRPTSDTTSEAGPREIFFFTYNGEKQIYKTIPKSFKEDMNLDKLLKQNTLLFPWLKHYRKISDEIVNMVDRYDQLIPFFNQYLWVIGPHTRVSTINQLYDALKSDRLSEVEFDSIMMHSFEKNNFQTIREVINRVKKSNRFPKRKDAIIDCLKSIQILDKSAINIALALLPSLIIQFDAMLTDFAEDRDLKYQPTKLYKSKDSDDRINAILSELSKNNPSPDDLNIINTIDCVLFQFNNQNGPAPLLDSFNRHNIIHGAVADYGKKEHIYRMVSLIDAFYELN